MRDVTEEEWADLRADSPYGVNVLAGAPVYARKGSKNYVMDWDLSAGEWVRMEIP